MRIVSKTKDYYDIVQGAGQNFDLQYIRTEIEEPLNPYPFVTFAHPRWMRPYAPLSILEHVIGFCGRVYPCLHLKLLPLQPGDYTICHTLADVDAFIERATRNKRVKKRQLDDYYKNTIKHPWWQSAWPPGWRQADFRKFFEQYDKQQDSKGRPFIVAKYFEEKRVPILVADYKDAMETRGVRRPGGMITYNALLRPHEFMRVFDPYTAFQEVQMYLANMAMPGRPIPQLSNDDLAHSKGHGDEYSFRRAPSK